MSSENRLHNTRFSGASSGERGTDVHHAHVMRAVHTRTNAFELEDHHAGDPLDQATLLRDTLLRTAIAAIPHNDTGSYRGDMLAVLRGWAALFSGEQAVAMR